MGGRACPSTWKSVARAVGCGGSCHEVRCSARAEGCWSRRPRRRSRAPLPCWSLRTPPESGGR
eukprot:8545999-Alexandrium_andersonii.AAC.1